MNRDDVNVFKYIRSFSCFEYAMKEAGYPKYRKDGSRAEPNWEKLIKEISDSLDIPEDNLLLYKPPQIQLVRDGKAKFETNGKDDGAPAGRRAIYAMKTVRNNLFHGGKLVRQEDFPRDYELIKAAQVVLDKCSGINNAIARKHKACLLEHINRSGENRL